ncbi:hypothetical protein, partial [Mesorhizobium sp. M7A.F.Ca.CA.004.05.2.1]|uniref:hypothetical protein n=1 Tax=Mesorhizobium sp. M7A.F.Ca.CA.004.05.2.1 TaxID=2496716 RepID=UPI0013E2B16D
GVAVAIGDLDPDAARKAAAIARPIPAPPPVTKARLPASSASTGGMTEAAGMVVFSLLGGGTRSVDIEMHTNKFEHCKHIFV